MKVKICGIIDVEIVKSVCEYGVDVFGFVFVESKWEIILKRVEEII